MACSGVIWCGDVDERRVMGKVLYSVTMSLDGVIAGPGGDMSWLTGHLGPNPAVDELQRNIGALLIGNRTFRGDNPNRGTDKNGAFSGTWTGPSFVLTHDSPQTTGARCHVRR